VTIDAHAHVIVPEALRDAAPDEDWRPRVFWEEGRQVIEHAGRRMLAAVAEFVDVERILEAQDAAGIDRVVLCPWVQLLSYDVEPDEGLRRCRLQNDALAGLARDHPERLSALGTVPLQDPALAARELTAVMAAGALRGVEVAASVRGEYLGDERFEPFWDAAEASSALVFIHPTAGGLGVGALTQHFLWNTVGNPLETTFAPAHMVMTGVLERHPSLRVLLAHGGGALLALRGRLRHAHGFQPQARSRLGEPVEDSIRRFHYDTITHDPTLLRALVDYVGPERVVLGSDYPFDMGDLRPAASVRALGLPASAEAAVLGGNAARLVGLEPTPREEMLR